MNFTKDLFHEVPSFIYVLVAQIREEMNPEQEFQQRIKEKYGTKCTEASGYLKILLNNTVYSAKMIKKEDCQLFILAAHPANYVGFRKNWVRNITSYANQIKPFLEMLPDNLLSVFTIVFGMANDQKDARELLRQYSNFLTRREKSVGMVYDCLLAMFEEEPVQKCLRKDFLIVTFNKQLNEGKAVFAELCKDITDLAMWAGKLKQLHLSHQIYFSQIDAAEPDIQERIQDIMVDLRTPGRMQPEHLEHRLRSVTTLFSDLSMLASAMRRNYLKVKSYLRFIESLFRRWNETSFQGYPMNSSVEAEEYLEFTKPFETFIDRVEALRIQLDTVFDAVRTYLNIQQQRQSAIVLERSHEELATMTKIAQTQEEARKKEEETKRAVQILQAITIAEVVVSIMATMLSYMGSWFPPWIGFMLIISLSISAAIFTYLTTTKT